MSERPVTFDALVRGKHLRRSDRARFLAAVGAVLWRPQELGLLEVVMRMRSGRVLLAEHWSDGVRVSVADAVDVVRP